VVNPGCHKQLPFGDGWITTQTHGDFLGIALEVGFATFIYIFSMTFHPLRLRWVKTDTA
jgi:hypothetical protein